jgi:TolB-like protein
MRGWAALLAVGLWSVTAAAQGPAKPAEPSSEPSSEKPKLLVLALEPAGGVAPDVASALTETVTTEVATRGLFDVLSTKDVQTLLGVERQKQMMGCSEEARSCLTELAGALGARFVLSGSVTKLGEAYQLNLQTLDTQRAQPIGRVTRISNDLALLRGEMPYAVAEATATPLPPPPSKLLPYSMMVGGGLVFIAGGVLTLQAVSREAAVNRELENGEQNPAALRPLASYVKERNELAAQKTWGFVGLGVGAALAGAGLYLDLSGILTRKAAPEPKAPTARLTFDGRGLALVGVLP